MPIDQTFRGLALAIEERKDPGVQPSLEYRFTNTGDTQSILARINGIVSGPHKGQLSFETNGGVNTPTQRLLIDEEGNVAIGGQQALAKLHVNGNAFFKGPLKIGEDAIDGAALSVGGDVLVKGKVEAGSARVGPLAVSDKIGIGVPEVGPDVILDVGSRMRVRQGNSSSAGVWFSQRTGGDKAFVGMADDNRVGFWGAGLNNWGLTMNTSDGSIQTGSISSTGSIFAKGGFGGGPISVGSGSFFGSVVIGSPLFGGNANLEVNGNLLCRGQKAFKIDHPLDPANKYLHHWCVESPNIMNIYNGNATTDDKGSATIVLPDYFEALNSDFRYQLTVVGKHPALAIVEREIENNTFTIKTSLPEVKVSWQVTGIRQDAAVKANRLAVEEEKPDANRGMVLYSEHSDPPEN